jgi:IS5 family transposase
MKDARGSEMGQKGFWDYEARSNKLSHKKPLLGKLNQLIPWHDFQPILETVYQQNRKSNAGRKPLNVVLMFKLLVLQQIYNISDDELEFQVNDRISFMEFLGLGIEDRIPDAKTVWLFRQRLIDHGLLSELFSRFDEHLREHGYTVESGQIVDATLVAAPKQRNTHKQNEQVKHGHVPEEWQRNPSVLRQKDLDARWAKRDGASFYGYKNHIGVDVQYGFIRRFFVTDACVHDSQALSHLLDIDAESIWGDSAYRSADIEWALRTIGFESHIHEKGQRNRPMSVEQKERNRKRSKIRGKVEHVFGQWVMRLGGKFVRLIGKVRVGFVIGLKNLVFNLIRYTFWEDQKQSVV